MTSTLLQPSRTGLRDLQRYLRVLAGEDPTGLLELRYAAPGGMRQLFREPAHEDKLARLIIALGSRTDVYIGAALRTRRHGGREAIGASHLVYIEIDRPHSHNQLQAFHARPTMVIASGTPGHLHTYWQLDTPAAPAAVEHANRTLAQHLGGDLASVDIARILRPPGTRNHKHTPPTPVALLELTPTRRYTLEQLTAGLPSPPVRPRPGRSGRWVRRHPLDQALLAIPARDYVPALTGRQPTRAGKLACPFHEDHTPSLQLYEDGSWYCFGCARGGSIYDFAALLWSSGQSSGRGAAALRGREFVEVRKRLLAMFFGDDVKGGLSVEVCWFMRRSSWR